MRLKPFRNWPAIAAPLGGIAEEKFVSARLSAGTPTSVSSEVQSTGRAEYVGPRATGKDWPDCEAKNAAGKTVAFEVTEFVDAAALSQETQPRQWSQDEIVTRLSAILAKKDQRGFGAGYAETVLLIHTDEFYLDPTHIETLLRAHCFRLRHRNLTKAFLLFGYSPQLGRCPYIELQLAV